MGKDKFVTDLEDLTFSWEKIFAGGSKKSVLDNVDNLESSNYEKR